MQHRIGYMAGWTFNHLADEMLLGFSSGRSNAIGQQNLIETFYLYRGIGSLADEAMNPATIANAFTLGATLFDSFVTI